MTRTAVPRWTLPVMAFAIVASMAFSIGAYSSVFGSSHGQNTPFYACMYAGSLSQVSQSPPTNCGRGSQIAFPSLADFIALQEQLGSDVDDLQAQIDQLNADLDAEREARIAADEALEDYLESEIERLEGLLDDLEAAVLDALAQLESDLLDEIADLQDQIDALQDALDDLSDALDDETTNRQLADDALQDQIDALNSDLLDAFDALSTLWQAIAGILTGDFDGAVTLLQDIAEDLGQLAEDVFNEIETFFEELEQALQDFADGFVDWFCSLPVIGELCD